MTILALFMFMGMMIIAGIAIDTSRLQARTTLLQATADSAAFAAIQRRFYGSIPTATAAAVQSARTNMPPEGYGTVLNERDVEWGVWDAASWTFRTQPAAGSTDPLAVRVTVRQSRANGNPFTNILLGWVGVSYAEPERVAVAAMVRDGRCSRQGFLSETLVDIRSNNEFYENFCMYGKNIDIQSNGFWEAGTVVMAPFRGNIDYQNHNTGLEAAIQVGSLQLPEIAELPDIIRSLRNSPATSPFTPSYIQPADRFLRTVPPAELSSNLTSDDLQAGRMYEITACPSSGTIKLSGVFNEVVLITDCTVTLTNNTVWGSSILATTSRAADSIDGAVGVSIGAPGGCAAGRSSQFLTEGGVKFPAKMRADGGHVIAGGEVRFAGNARPSDDGPAFNGISIIAKGMISGTSRMIMGACGGTGLDTTIRIPQFRLVQ